MGAFIPLVILAHNYEDYNHWQKIGMKELENALDSVKNINENRAKNIIIFIGDGMGITTQTASRIYKAQQEGRRKGLNVSGEESLLTFETFPHVGLSKTYANDR